MTGLVSQEATHRNPPPNPPPNPPATHSSTVISLSPVCLPNRPSPISAGCRTLPRYSFCYCGTPGVLLFLPGELRSLAPIAQCPQHSGYLLRKLLCPSFLPKSFPSSPAPQLPSRPPIALLSTAQAILATTATLNRPPNLAQFT